MDSSRRKFLIALGAGAMAGWLASPGILPRISPTRPRNHGGHCPVLADGIAPRTTARARELVRIDSSRAIHVVGEINESAWKVLSRMDGLHTVEDIARAMATSHPSGDPDACRSAIALFLAELAMAGLLAEPFHVDIHRTEFSA
ncbi:MAG TPA: PqqD family protein [Fibrobacteria bacterium]|nr:PqqD family protein [Fibrobacteria bacterium]HOX50019.1 PqqD family protein [Fibrobacteria bacterium]